MSASIRGRLYGLAALWLVAALLGAWLAIGAVLDRFVTGRFDAEASAVTDALIAASDADATGRLRVTPGALAPQFSEPLSGWYWQINADDRVAARSASLFDTALAIPAGDAEGQKVQDPSGEMLRITSRGFTVPDIDAALRVTVSLPQAAIDAALRDVRRPLAVSLLILGAGLALAVVVQVNAGLRPLRRLTRDIAAIRAGRAERMPDSRVSELRPVTTELNALLDQNRAVLMRAREHIGNLAHSLKTPLSVLANELPDSHAGQPLIARMNRQIGWHLRRARSAAAPNILGERTSIAEVIGDILLVLRGPMRDRGLSFATDCPAGAVFYGERQDLEEMIGNLAENAVNWARTHIRISVAGGPDGIAITLADDGPGMADDDFGQALTRGARLDERGNGAGLGLAIVSDLARLHDGALALARSPLGGLAATLTLPGAT